jgi:hypothetical protein
MLLLMARIIFHGAKAAKVTLKGKGLLGYVNGVE